MSTSSPPRPAVSKRLLAEVGGVVSEFSPHYKLPKIEAMAAFLKTRFRLRQNSSTLKARVLEVVVAEHDSSATLALVGRGVYKAFGSKVTNKGRKIVGVYTEIQEYRARCIGLGNNSPTKIPIPSINAPKGHRPVESQHPNAVIRPHGSKLPIISSRGTAVPDTNAPLTALPTPTPVSRNPTRSIPINVSADEARLIGMMRNDDPQTFDFMLKKCIYPHVQESSLAYTEKVVQREVQSYACLEQSLLRKSKAIDMESFSLMKCLEEFEQRMPTVTRLIFDICTNSSQHKQGNIRKTIDYVTPAIATVIGKCLGIYSQKLSAQRTFYSIIFSSGGLTNASMNRMARLYDCTTHQSILPKLDDIASRYDVDLKEWISESEQYGVVFDNVDAYVKPRRELAMKSNTMHHMVHAIAVKERVTSTKLELSSPPLISIDAILPIDVLPTNDDICKIKSLMVNEVLKIWNKGSALQSLKLPINQERHKYSHCTKKKSSMVNLGVLAKNENVKEELLVCLKEYHSLIGLKDGMPDHKLCIGDYLSFERGQQVISSQSDGVSSVDRLEGLIMACADFHVQLNFLKMGFKILFHGDSQPSVGTLSHAKDFLNARNVTGDAKRYYDCGALFDKVFNAYIDSVGEFSRFSGEVIILAAIMELGVTLTEVSRPHGPSSSDTAVPLPSHLTATSVTEAAQRVVSNFVDLTIPDISDSAKIKCLHCRKKYSSAKNLRKHHLQAHRDKEMNEGMADRVHDYSCALVTVGLLRSIHNRAIQLGDGACVLLLYKLFYLIFKANGSYKYGCGLLETVLQTYVLPRDLSVRLTWNRFYNSRGNLDSNIPLDLQMEHENRLFKDRLKTYRGEYSQAHLDRISKGRGQIDKMIRSLDDDIGYHKTSGLSKSNAAGDINMLTRIYSTSGILSRLGDRAHSLSTYNVTKNLTAGLNGSSLKSWVTDRINICRIRNYYRQFRAEGAM